MNETTTLYRFLTGPDDPAFCHRVSEALSRGWQLHGSPSLTYDAARKQVIAGQAIICYPRHDVPPRTLRLLSAAGSLRPGSGWLVRRADRPLPGSGPPPMKRAGLPPPGMPIRISGRDRGHSRPTGP